MNNKLWLLVLILFIGIGIANATTTNWILDSQANWLTGNLVNVTAPASPTVIWLSGTNNTGTATFTKYVVGGGSWNNWTANTTNFTFSAPKYSFENGDEGWVEWFYKVGCAGTGWHNAGNLTRNTGSYMEGNYSVYLKGDSGYCIEFGSWYTTYYLRKTVNLTGIDFILIDFNSTSPVLEYYNTTTGTWINIEGTMNYYYYQENATADSYGVEDGWTNPENINDSDWGTYGNRNATAGTSSLTFTYNIPAYAGINGTFWQIKDNATTYNLTVNADCWNTNVPLHLNITSTEAGTSDYVKWNCRNWTDWFNNEVESFITLRTSTVGSTGSRVYEEAMYWNITEPYLLHNKTRAFNVSSLLGDTEIQFGSGDTSVDNIRFDRNPQIFFSSSVNNATYSTKWYNLSNVPSNGFLKEEIFFYSNDTAYKVDWTNVSYEIGYSITNLSSILEQTTNRMWINFTSDLYPNVTFGYSLAFWNVINETANDFANDTGWLNIANVMDTNWSSYGERNTTAGNSTLWMNYTIPTNAQRLGSIWLVADGATVANASLTVDASCWATPLEFKVISVESASTTDRTYWYCLNKTSSAWILLRNNTAITDGDRVWSERMSWNITADNNDYTWANMTKAVGSFKDWYYDWKAPTVSANAIYNYAYNWTDMVGNYQVDVGTTIYNIAISNSTGYPILNVTFLNETSEEALASVIATTIFTILNDDGTNEIQSFSTTGNQVFYITPNWSSIRANVNFQYSKATYATREYYLYNSTLSNNTLNLTMYDGLSASVSGTIFTIKDDALTTLENVYIYAERFYPASNTYKTIAMGKTDSNGQDAIYLFPNTQFYRFILMRDGEILKTTEPMKMTSSAISFYINLLATESKMFDLINNVQFNIDYNDGTNTLLATIVSPSGLYNSICMNVFKETGVSQIQECSSCGSGTALILTCPLSSNISYYSIKVYGLGSFGNIYNGFLDLTQGSADTLAGYGIYLSLFMILVIGMIGIFHPVASIITWLLGIVGAKFMGILDIPYSIITTLAVVAVVVIWRMRSP